jgi:peptidoglycan/LPS O-acetylase OafA/YrhL
MPRSIDRHDLWFGSKLNPQRNSLNLIRLVLALAVLVHHCWPLMGLGGGPEFAGEWLGGWAVAGFFSISGYLITGSRLNNRLGDYLVHRVARIMPAFLTCLLFMVVVIAPLGYLAAKGTLSGYLSTTTTPLNYLFSNMFLKMQYADISGGPYGVPYPGAWNGSLWSLYYEFVCYLIIAALGLFALVRKSPWPITIAFVASVVVQANIEKVSVFLGQNYDFILLMRLLPFFLGGSVLFLWRHRVGLHWMPGLLAILSSLIIMSAFPGWGGPACGALVAYALLWTSSWLPSPEFVHRNDISYGVYIYAFPIQQLLAVYGLHQLGLAAYMTLSAGITIGLALASWFFVEQPIMKRVRKGKSDSGVPRNESKSSLPEETNGIEKQGSITATTQVN